MSRMKLVVTSGFVVLTVSLWAAAARSQDDRLAKSLGLTASDGSLPLWTKPSADALRDLGEFAREAQQGVMLVGYQQNHGTAWVISKQHRLLATNAHVADILLEAKGKMFAIPNGTSTLYSVERVWYHPGVRRRVGGVSAGSFSDKPEEGSVDPNSPDVAVLQLSSAGPDLPYELPMAGPEVFPTLFAQTAAILGYPGHDTSWPALGDTPGATFHEGVVSRLTNFQNSASCDLSEKQFLQYTMSTWGGFSGSPILLPSGKVVAIHNSARIAENEARGFKTSIAHGIRIDSLWELLVHHHLTDKVPIPVASSSVNVARWFKEDPRDKALREAIALVEEGVELLYTKQDHAGGAQKCNEAIKLVPTYAFAYSERSSSHVNYVATYRLRLTAKQRAEQLAAAEKDAQRAMQLDPTNPAFVLDLAAVYCSAAIVLDLETAQRRELLGQAIAIAEKVMQVPGLEYPRAYAFSIRGAANDGLGRYDQALLDHNEAVRLAPNVPGILWSRSEYWRTRGRPDLQQRDLAEVARLRSEGANSLENDLKILTSGREQTWKLTEQGEHPRDLRLTLQKAGFQGRENVGTLNSLTPNFSSLEFTWKLVKKSSGRFIEIRGKGFEQLGPEAIIEYSLDGDVLTLKSGTAVFEGSGPLPLQGNWEVAK